MPPLRVALTTLGCKVNFAEMADLAGEIAASGFDVVADDQPADVRVLNSCTVTLQADATTRQRLHKLRRDDPSTHLILTGCSVDGNPERFAKRGADGVDAVFANADKQRIAGYISDYAAVSRPSAVPVASAAAPPRSRAFIKVQDGCDHRCTYCVVWRVRGRSVSAGEDDIVERAHTAVARGHQEIVLTGVDIGSWGRGSGTSLARLVARLLDAIPQARFRISSLNANDFTPELIALNAHERLCPHFHIPLQSGSDAMLKAMHRGYRCGRFTRVVDALRSHDPLTEITTDIMVAFPGETEEHHRDTLSLIANVGFLHAHVFRYSARTGTLAAALDSRVDDRTARRRSGEAIRAAALAGQARRNNVIGREVEVVWDRLAGDTARGVASTWHTVVVDDCAGAVLGRRDRVSITGIADGTLRGVLLR